MDTNIFSSNSYVIWVVFIEGFENFNKHVRNICSWNWQVVKLGNIWAESKNLFFIRTLTTTAWHHRIVNINQELFQFKSVYVIYKLVGGLHNILSMIEIYKELERNGRRLGVNPSLFRSCIPKCVVISIVVDRGNILSR